MKKPTIWQLASLLLIVASIFLADWLEVLISGRSTGIGITLGWIVGVLAVIGIERAKNSG